MIDVMKLSVILCIELTADSQEVIDGGDVIHRFGQESNPQLPGAREHVSILLSHTRAGTGCQNASCVDHLPKAHIVIAFTILNILNK